MSKFTREELKKIAALLAEAYAEAGKELKTAGLVVEDAETGELSEDLLLDNRDKENLN